MVKNEISLYNPLSETLKLNDKLEKDIQNSTNFSKLNNKIDIEKNFKL